MYFSSFNSYPTRAFALDEGQVFSDVMDITKPNDDNGLRSGLNSLGTSVVNVGGRLGAHDTLSQR